MLCKYFDEDNELLKTISRTFLGRGQNMFKFNNYSEEDVFNLFINGRYFHSDAKKDKNLSEIEGFFGLPISEIMLTNALIYKTRAIISIYLYLNEEI